MANRMKNHRNDQQHDADAPRDLIAGKEHPSDAGRRPDDEERHSGDATAEVAACTAAAAHRRDHHHEGKNPCCQPHCVQVVYLGQRAVTVCHDCQMDSGFLPHRAAERLADQHREDTRTASVPFPGAPAA